MLSVEDEVMLLLAVVIRRRRRRRFKIPRRYWTHPYWTANVEGSSQFVTTQQLIDHPEKFKNFYRMEKGTFNKLCNLVRNWCTVGESSFRQSICIEERLKVFLRYLTTGMTFTSLAYEFYRGVSTISEIVEHIAECLWDTLQKDYLPMPSTEEWITISKRFYEQWNMPNCLGSIDGKHIRIKCPQNSGSAYYNYQGFFSIVLLGCVDADSLFTWISVGDYGRNSDGRVIKSAGVIEALENNELNLPNPQPLPNTVEPSFPFYFIGDQGFPLKTNLLRPYPKKTADNKKRVFNYRLSRPRKTVECAFGMLAHKFRLFLTQIECNPEKATKLVKAACILHNFIKMHDGVIATPSYENEITTGHPFKERCLKDKGVKRRNSVIFFVNILQDQKTPFHIKKCITEASVIHEAKELNSIIIEAKVNY